MTTINDYPGGGMLPEHFNAVQQLWQKGEQTLRVTFHISGDSLAEYKALTAFTPMNFGDDWLHFRGIGESLTRGMYDGSTVGLPYNPSDKDRAEFCEVAKWAAEQYMNVHQHAASDKAASMILDCFEAVNKVLPIAGLRWQIAHLENASETTLARMKALNMGWAVQDRLVYSGGIVGKVLGPEGSKRAPPIATGLKMGLHVSGGTDSDQVAPYNPFVSLRWLLDGKVIDGTSMAARKNRVARAGAADVFGELRLVHLRRGHSRHPRARQICRSRRALRRLHDGAGGEGGRPHIGAHRDRRQGRLRRRPVRRAGGEAVDGPSFRGARLRANPESSLRCIVARSSGFRVHRCAVPRNDRADISSHQSAPSRASRSRHFGSTCGFLK